MKIYVLVTESGAGDVMEKLAPLTRDVVPSVVTVIFAVSSNSKVLVVKSAGSPTRSLSVKTIVEPSAGCD